MTFIVDQLFKVVMLKVFGTTRPKFVKFTNGGTGDYFDPYFETFIDANGNAKLITRRVPESVPKELNDQIISIKNTCYWMDESFFGLKVSNFLNRLFGARGSAEIEREYTTENLNQADGAVAHGASSSNTNLEGTGATTYRSRRLGFGFGPLLQALPFIGNYIVLTINMWIFFCMLTVGFGVNVKWNKGKVKFQRKPEQRFLGFKDLGSMIFNIVVDFGIGFIPFVGMFISIIHRSSSRNLAVFWKSLDQKYGVKQKGI